MRKAICLTLASVLVLGACLAACNKDGGGNSQGGGSSWEYVPGGKLSETPVTVTFLTQPGTGSGFTPISNDLIVWQKVQEDCGITIDWQLVEPEVYGQVVATRLMSSDLPDMATIPEDLLSKLGADGALLAFDELGYEKNAPFTRELLKDPAYAPFEKVFRSLLGDGKMYFIASTLVPNAGMFEIILNKPWLDALGLEEPTTLDELFDTLVAFRDNDPNGNGEKDEIPFAPVGINIMSFTFTHIFDYDYNYQWELDANGKLQSTITTERFRDYIEYYKKLYDNDLIDKENRDMAANYELMAQDRLGGIAYYGTFQRLLAGYAPSYDPDNLVPIWQELATPIANPRTGERHRFTRLNNGMTQATAILDGANNPEICLRLLDYFWGSPDFEMMKFFGIEGLSYDITDGKVVTKVPEDYTGTVAFINTLGGMNTPWANRQSWLQWTIVNPPYVISRWEEKTKYYKDGLTPAMLSAEDMNEASKYQTDVNTYRDEMIANFVEGRRPLGDWDKFVAEINQIGMLALRDIYAKYHE